MKKFFNFLISVLILIIYIEYKVNGYESFYVRFISDKQEFKVLRFTKSLDLEVVRQMKNIQNEIIISKKKIKKLNELKKLFPNEKEIIDKALFQWQNINKNLSSTYQNIYLSIEKSYIIFKVNEIEGYQNFNNESKKLLEQANKALKDAEETKLIIEKSFNYE